MIQPKIKILYKTNYNILVLYNNIYKTNSTSHATNNFQTLQSSQQNNLL